MNGDPFDLIVVGSGIAGLYASLLAASDRRVLLITKGALEESNTRYAQGGIAVALSHNDSPELHLRDTIVAGDGLCDPAQVAILTHDAPACIRDLLDRGVPFDRENGELAWTLEAAHSLPRVLHAGGDATGASIEQTLARAVRNAGVRVLEHTLCTSLLHHEGRIRGVELLTEKDEQRTVEAPYVILATGGAGQLFIRTTNPPVATGDGLALAYRAGADLMDLEFMQFHPTALVLDGVPSFLISEAVRGEGGILRDHTGFAFMASYHADRELAPRDVVARAIHRQMTLTGARHVWLDLTHLAPNLVERRFPSVVRFCRTHGIDPVRQPVPVAPAAHYLMGGVRTDEWARTTVTGLLACGEVACTGVHGANRLASNSLLEGLVFAHRAVEALSLGLADSAIPSALAPRSRRTSPEIPVLDPAHRVALAALMWRHASVERSAASLQEATLELAQLQSSGHPVSVAQHEATNLGLLAGLMLQSAITREESRGAHYRSDFPQREQAWQRHIVLSREGEGRIPVTPMPAGMPVHG